MRYSKAAASLLSSFFTFQAKSVAVVADIFDPEVDVGALAPTTRGKYFKKKCKDGNEADCRKSYGKNIVKKRPAPAPDATADTGILAAAPSPPSTCAAANVVECDNGFLANDDTTSCYTACAGACCVYVNGTGVKFDACEHFTGKVCKDQVSCTGYRACKDAYIPSGVVKSCSGNLACFLAGYDYGKIGKIVDSCNGNLACAYVAAEYGSVGDIIGSCNGYVTCYLLGSSHSRVGKVLNSCIEGFACAALGGTFGVVGDITDSCIGDSTCQDIGFKGGKTGSIKSSCNGYYSCYYLGSYGGRVGDLSNACNAEKACYFGAKYGGAIGSITNACTADYSCYYSGYGAGNVGNIKDSCTALSACGGVGFKRGSIGSISTSCNAEYACFLAGQFTGVITSNLNGCCNTVDACLLATPATLPAQCKSKSGKRARAM